MKKTSLLILLALSSTGLFAQSIERYAISAAGGSWNDGASTYLDYTAGEVVITTMNNANNFLTQGFQQPFTNQTVAVEENPIETPSTLVYPNPVVDAMNIQLNGLQTEACRVLLMDVLGQLLYDETFSVQNTDSPVLTIDLRKLATGNYYLRVMQGSNVLHTGKIIKINQ